MALVLTVHQKWQIKIVMLTILLIKYHNSIRECTYLLCVAVVHPSLSPLGGIYMTTGMTAHFCTSLD
jgi:hypothetical protein